MAAHLIGASLAWHLHKPQKNGQIYYDERTIAPILDEHGRVTHYISSGVDVTDRVEGEQALRKSYDRARCQARILAAISEADSLTALLPRLLREAMSLVHGEKCCIHLVEGERVRLRAFEGFSREFCEQVADMPAQDSPSWLRETYVLDGSLDEARSRLDFARREGIQSWISIPLSLPNGQWLGTLILCSTKPGALRESEAQALRGISQHLALAIHHTQLREDLQRTQALLVQRERLHALGQMASGIAHDVNNSLVPVLVLAEQLLAHPDLQVREVAQRILQAGQDIAQMIRRLRSFCSGRPAEDTFESVCLNELVRQAVEWTQPRWKDMAQHQGKTIDITWELDPNLPTTAGLPNEIREALVNLILNAVDAILAKPDRNGTITFRSRADAENILLEVSDTGIGMDEETCQRALEPFFTTKGPQGCGLGLPMVYGVMQRHGGRLEIRSVPNTGTTVCLRFPRRSLSHSPRAPAPTPCPTGLHVLVVDDDPRVRETLVMMIRSLGHRVTAAEDGVQALAHFQRHQHLRDPVQVVITDLGMPGLSGEDVVREIKTLSPHTPVIVLTGWGQDAKPPQADYGLAKPVMLADLQTTLAATWNTFQARWASENGALPDSERL